ncbi:MAG TPA: M14 family metallopeptidase [Nevskiaceae bacterium]|nr:M14 family metallopeptidase [Nevskiaceae bacterium]
MSRLARRRRAAAALLLACASASAEVLRYTENPGGPDDVALGYPVPLPLDTQAATDGFRAYEPLLARVQALALDSDDLRAQRIGRTVADRPIWAFVAGDADATTPRGATESALLIDGTIHAREWASPEVVTGTLERLLAPEAKPGLRRYVLDTQSVVFIPVLNVDGFLQTQRYPDRVLRTEYAGDPSNWPRDGRMQRKNMRDKDEILCAADDPGCVVHDGMRGVDGNRNHEPWWASSGGSSSNPGSLVYHGTAPASEPESRALYAAADLGPESRIRAYFDVHSFGRVFNAVHTGNTRRDAQTRLLGTRVRAVTGNRYAYVPTSPEGGIGSTDEHFGYGLQVPSYTLEIEPGSQGAVEYGGFGDTHDGFILPEAEVARVRDELADALLLAMVCRAGPPSVVRVEVRRASDAHLVFEGHWTATSAQARRFTVGVRESLQVDTGYRLRVVFDKPMRVRSGADAVRQYRGQAIALAPTLSLEGLDEAGRDFSTPIAATKNVWRSTDVASEGYERYADDTLVVAFRIPADTPIARARRVNFNIATTDVCGQALDADPSTVADWVDGGWRGYEDDDGSSATDTGGADRAARVVDDGSPLFGPGGGDGGDGGGGGGGGAFTWWTLLALLAAGAWARRR